MRKHISQPFAVKGEDILGCAAVEPDDIRVFLACPWCKSSLDDHGHYRFASRCIVSPHRGKPFDWKRNGMRVVLKKRGFLHSIASVEAAEWNEIEIFGFLMQAGANWSIVDRDGSSTLIVQRHRRERYLEKGCLILWRRLSLKKPRPRSSP